MAEKGGRVMAIKPAYSTVLDPYNPIDKWIIRLKQEVAFNETIEISDVDALELIGIMWNYKRLNEMMEREAK